MKFKDPITGEYKTLYLKTGDTLPVGAIVSFEGDEIPEGYEEVIGEEARVVISPTEPITGEEVWIDNVNKKIYIKNDNDVYEEFYKNNGIVESGSNENGKYVKFADGTMICRHTFSKTLSFPTEWGGWYEGTISNVPFPQSFVGEIPDISLDKTRGAEAIVGTVNPTLTGIESATLQRPTTATDVACVFSYIAIGKWR